MKNVDAIGLGFDVLYPTINVRLLKDGRERRYQLSSSTKFDGWIVWIDRADREVPEVRVILDADTFLEAREVIEREIAVARAEGWRDA